MNPKGHASSSSCNPNEPVRKVNVVISLCFGQEFNNQLRNPNEPCRCPHQFFQNSSPLSTPEAGLSSQLEDTTDGIPNASNSPSSPESHSKK